MNLQQKNKERWDNMHILASKGPAFKSVADVLKSPLNKARYENVSKGMKDAGFDIPWEFIAVAHYREAGFNQNGQPRWETYLGNGQLLSKKTTIVPKGRGPFSSWEDGAIDALVYAPPYAAKNKDWTIGGTLTKLEEYNGLGYAGKNLPSPYIWAGTDQYIKGKYVKDNVYDPDHVDTQLGCAGLLKFMGYGSVPAAVTPVFAGGGAAIAAVATAAAVSKPDVWAHITNHLWAYGITAGLVGIFIALAVYSHNHKDELSV